MYKFIFSFLLLSSTLYSQGVDLIGRPGFNFSKMNSANIPFKENATFKPGYSFGVGALVPIKSRHEIQANLFYENKGRKMEFPYDKVRSNFNFLVFSSTFNYKARQDLPLFIKLGLYSGYLLKQKSKIIGERINIVDDTHLFTKIDYGPLIGINWRFGLWENIQLGIEESFAFSLQNTFKRPEDERRYDFRTYKHFVFATTIELIVVLQ